MSKSQPFRVYTTLRAVDPFTHQTQWVAEKVTSKGTALHFLTLIDNVLLADTVGEVIALDAQNGTVIWQSYKGLHGTAFTTRAVTIGNDLYALRYDARLVRLSVQTGVEDGYIQFEPPSISTQYGYPHLASDGRMLFVSFDNSDTNELIALGP